MPKLADFSSITETFGQRNFRIYTYGASISLIGTWVHRIAVGWLTWELTHSFVWLGIISFAELFPTIVLTPFAGAITDRMDRKLLAVGAQVCACLQAVAMAALIYAGLMNIWLLLALQLYVGVVFSFSTAVRLAIFPSLVERPYISSAIAINAAFFNLARFAGPALGGFLIAQWGIAAAFAFNAASFLGFIVSLSLIRMLRSETAGRERTGILTDMREGFAYVMRHPGIGPVLLVLIALAIGVKALPEMLPGYVDTVLSSGVEAFAQLTAASGIGAAIAAVWVAGRGRVDGLTRLSLLYLLIAALSTLLFMLWSNFYVGLACLFVLGAAITVIGTGVQSLMQNAVDGAMRGRVMSLYGVIFRGGPALGALALGGLAELIGLRATFLMAGAATVLAWLWLVRGQSRMAAALEAEPEKGKDRIW